MKGRSGGYSAALAERICSRIGRGESLRAVCTTRGMPTRATVGRWLKIHADFREAYARARARAGTDKAGPRSRYSRALAERICTRLAEGESLRAMCGQDGLPTRITVFNWLAAHADFRERYGLARTLQAESYADEIVWIADTAENPQLAKVQIDARKWTAAILAPKKYGEAVKHEHSGSLTLEALLAELDAEASASETSD